LPFVGNFISLRLEGDKLESSRLNIIIFKA
jgi:hypothetical protein